MATDLKLDMTGDIELVNGEATIIEGDDALRQRLWERLRIQQGTWFLDINFGVPYYERVLGKTANMVALNAVFFDAILGTPGVSRLSKPIHYDFDATLRRLQIEFEVVSETGELVGVTL